MHTGNIVFTKWFKNILSCIRRKICMSKITALIVCYCDLQCYQFSEHLCIFVFLNADNVFITGGAMYKVYILYIHVFVSF